MNGDAKGLRRSGLTEVLAALTDDDRGWWAWQMTHTETFRLTGRAVVCEGYGLAARRRDGGVFWAVTDPREALELLQVRGLAPEDDVRRGFDVRRSLEKAIGRMPPMKGGSAAADGFVIELIGYPENWQTPTVELRRGGISRRAQMADTHDESHPRYSVESTTLGLAAAWPEPGTIPDLVAVTSLSVPTILRAEELARETVARLRPWGCPQTERVVWRVGERRNGSDLCWLSDVKHGGVALCVDGFDPSRARTRGIRSAQDVWSMGLALDSITADAVVIVVPVVGSP